MPLADMAEQAKALQGSLKGMAAEAHHAGTEMEGVTKSLLSLGGILKGTGIVGLLSSFSHVLSSLKQNGVEERARVVTARKLADNAKEELAYQQEHYRAMLAARGTDPQALLSQRNMVAMSAKQAANAEKNVGMAEEGVALLSRGNLLISGAIFLIGAELDLWKHVVNNVHEYQQALMQTSTDYANRFRLIQQMVNVQGQLGASSKSIAESAEALVDFGQHLTPTFQQNLRLVTMMKEGLGISAKSGAELVTVFSRQLHGSAKDIADVMAQIAANTGLAADKAAQFAVEIAKSLRLFGPAAGAQAPGIARVVETLAGRVREMGGNERSIIEMHRRLTSMDQSGFVLRSFGGGTPISNLRTEAGTQTALQNIARDLQRQLGPPGTSDAEIQSYMIRAKQFGDMIGMEANDLVNFIDSMEHVNKATNQATDLQKAWHEQTAELGKAFGMLKESVGSLLMQAFLPLLQEITPLVAETAALIRNLTQSKAAINAVRTAFEYLTKGMVKMIHSALGLLPSGGAAGNILGMLLEAVSEPESIKSLTGLVKDWKVKSETYMDKQTQNVQVKEAVAKTPEQTAAELLARMDLAKTNTEAASLENQFKTAYALAQSQGATMESVSAAAYSLFKSGVWTEMLQRGRTTKTDEERQRDEHLAVLLEQLEMMKKAYEEHRKGVAVTKEAVSTQQSRDQDAKDQRIFDPKHYNPSETHGLDYDIWGRAPAR